MRSSLGYYCLKNINPLNNRSLNIHFLVEALWPERFKNKQTKSLHLGCLINVLYDKVLIHISEHWECLTLNRSNTAMLSQWKRSECTIQDTLSCCKIFVLDPNFMCVKQLNEIRIFDLLLKYISAAASLQQVTI